MTILVTKRTLDALEMLFYHLAAFRVNFSVMFMDLHTNDPETSSPGKYKKTDLRVSTVSTRRHALTSVRFDVFILWKIV